MEQKTINTLDQVIDKVRASKIPVARISRETGLNEQWLRAFLRGDYNDPGFLKVQTLSDYLAGVVDAMEGRESA